MFVYFLEFYALFVFSDHSQTDCTNCGAKGSSSDSEEYCGLLMLDGNLGRENWRIPLRECPVDLQCDLVTEHIHRNQLS